MSLERGKGKDILPWHQHEHMYTEQINRMRNTHSNIAEALELFTAIGPLYEDWSVQQQVLYCL